MNKISSTRKVNSIKREDNMVECFSIFVNVDAWHGCDAAAWIDRQESISYLYKPTDISPGGKIVTEFMKKCPRKFAKDSERFSWKYK